MVDFNFLLLFWDGKSHFFCGRHLHHMRYEFRGLSQRSESSKKVIWTFMKCATISELTQNNWKFKHRTMSFTRTDQRSIRLPKKLSRKFVWRWYPLAIKKVRAFQSRYWNLKSFHVNTPRTWMLSMQCAVHVCKQYAPSCFTIDTISSSLKRRPSLRWCAIVFPGASLITIRCRCTPLLTRI